MKISENTITHTLIIFDFLFKITPPVAIPVLKTYYPYSTSAKIHRQPETDSQ
jgi:hypothetical protein